MFFGFTKRLAGGFRVGAYVRAKPDPLASLIVTLAWVLIVLMLALALAVGSLINGVKESTMSKGSIRLSPKHGLNPSMGVCFFCGEDDGTIVLPGMMKNDREAPRRAIWSREPCPKCKDLMSKGIMLAEAVAVPGKEPERTGSLVVITEEAAARMFSQQMAEALRKSRFGFIDSEAWRAIGFDKAVEADSKLRENVT